MAATSTPVPTAGPEQKSEPGESSARSSVSLRKYGTPSSVVSFPAISLAPSEQGGSQTGQTESHPCARLRLPITNWEGLFD